MAEKTTKKETTKTEETIETKETPKPKCGVIMPISPIDGCSAEHWADVKEIIEEVVSQTEFECDLVSNANEVAVIHTTIVQNIYFNEMVICDVSGKNPNVMFELGLRIAFDKPAIIIKDDVTDYSFDTSPIEQLTYPRDLNYGKINTFKEHLKDKLIATYEISKAGNFSPFLKSFGKFEVSSLETKEISSEKYILKSLEELKTSISRLENKRRQENFSEIYGSVIASKNTMSDQYLVKGVSIYLFPNLGYDKVLIESMLSVYFNAKITGEPDNNHYLLTFDTPISVSEVDIKMDSFNKSNGKIIKSYSYFN